MSENNTPNAAPVAVEQVPVAEPVSTDESTENLEVSQEESSEAPVASEKAPSDKKEEAKIAKKIKQLKLKVDGKEFDEDLPFEVEEGSEAEKYLKDNIQRAKAAAKRMSEAADYKKKLDTVSDYLQQAQGNPKKIRELMKDLKIDEKELAAMIVQEEIERQAKSPEQLEKEKLQEELRQLKEENEKSKKDAEQREYERLLQAEGERYEAQFEKALSGSKLPKTPYMVKKMADWMMLANQKGYEISAEDVIPLLREELKGDIKQMFDASSEDFIEEFLGKDNLKRLRERNLKKAKETPPVPVNKSIADTGAKPSKEAKEEARVSFRDYFKKI